MTIKKAVEQTIDSGIHPIVLDAQRVKNFGGEIEGVRTSLIVKSLSLGTLTANEYRFVARRTLQANRLVERNIEKLFYFYPLLLKEHLGAKFFTVSVYARTLRDGQLLTVLTDYLRKYPVDPTKIYLEMSADILFENLPEYKKEIDNLRNLGFKIALCEVGSEFCPLLRLNEIPYDIVFLDDYAQKSLQDDREQEIQGLMSIITARITKVYGSCVSVEQIPYLEKIGADGYTFAEDEDLEEKEWHVGAKEKEESPFPWRIQPTNA